MGVILLGDLIRRTEKRLRAARLHYGHGTDNPHDEAAFLVLRGLGLPFDADLGQAADPSRVEPLVQKRIKERTPAAYLLNEAWLCGVPFYVDRRVIIPRSHIAGLLAERLEPWQPRPLRRILDLCTGSGCLAVLAARAFPLALVDASDLSAAALAAGRKGLDVVARILSAAERHLTQRGVLVCEVGDGRAALEKAWPRLELLWPGDEVFIARRDALASAARTGASPRTRPTPARASR
jgi:methylase of polypeptide subunit release factors